VLFTYERLLLCIIKTKINDIATVRIPCPEIQVIADKALSRPERVRVIKDVIDEKRYNVKINYCLLTINHRLYSS